MKERTRIILIALYTVLMFAYTCALVYVLVRKCR